MAALSLYKASAGSGKTFQLTRNYLEMLLRAEDNYRAILAVTFTNKAASELKDRVLDELVLIATGRQNQSQHYAWLSETLKRDADILVPRTRRILEAILEDYSHFSVGTIDEFFQRILRSFARELGVYAGYAIELKPGPVIDLAVESLISQSELDPELYAWFLDGIRENLEEGYNWKRFEKELKDLGNELMKEKMSLLLLQPGESRFQRSEIKSFRKRLHGMEKAFEKQMTDFGKEADELFERFQLTADDFSQKMKGPAGALIRLAQGDFDIGGKQAYADDPDKWLTKSVKEPLRSDRMTLVTNHFHPLFVRAFSFHQANYQNYLHSALIRKNLLWLGLISALAEEINRVSREKGLFLISLTNPVISALVSHNPAPFIYERTGTYYQHLMIDEFQDTSNLQWTNFLPLLREALSTEGKVFLVGDAKQSIYRWRNSNWQLIAHQAEADLPQYQGETRSLTRNFRSRQSIVDFNSQFFSRAADSVIRVLKGKVTTGHPDIHNLLDSFSQIYADAVQDYGRKTQGGYVRIQKVASTVNGPFPSHFPEVLSLVVELQQVAGYQAKDIVFLVRSNRESAELIRYFNSVSPDYADQDGVNLELISGESLSLGSSPEIRALMDLFRLSLNPKEFTYLGEFVLNLDLVRFGHLRPESAEALMLRERDRLFELSGINQPDAFFDWVNALVLPERMEYLIRFLGLSVHQGALPFLFTLKEELRSVLAGAERNSAEELLEWWDEEGYLKLISMENQVNAMKTMTIHKAKGLEFPVVIMTDVNWTFDHSGNNAPYLWLDTASTIFEDMPVVPLKYVKALADGPFSADYFREKIQVYLDNLNLLYVAFTRASERLHLFIPEKQNGFRVGSLLGELVFSTESPDAYDFGDEETRKSEPVQEILETPPVQLPEGRLMYAKPAGSGVSEARHRGSDLHEVLEHIRKIEDLEKLEALLTDYGFSEREERSRLGDQIRLIINHPKLKPVFDGSGKVYNERSILVPGFGQIRPDRVVEKDKDIYVLEYKSGVANAQHRSQLSGYRDSLRQMGYSKIYAFLIYLDSGEVVEI